MYCYGLRFMIDNVHYFSGDIKMATDEKKEPVYKDLQAEDPDVVPTEIESMCMNCGENVSFLSFSTDI